MTSRTRVGDSSEPGVAIRAIRLPEERDLFAGLSVSTFSPSAPWEATRRFWGEYVTGLPYFRPGHWLGAFEGDSYLGGVALYRRVLRVGAARVPLGCIASLTVRPEHRGRGLATALLLAAEALALDRGDAAILLHGIPRLYRKLGYADVHDPGWTRVTRQALDTASAHDALPVRPASPDDAPALLRLFERHFGSRVGAFDRDPRLQQYFLEWRIRDGCPIVACDPAGTIRGYVVFEWSRKRWRVNEAVAEDWTAALALLRHVAERQDAREDGAADVRLPCPPDSTLAMAVADNVWATHETEHDADSGWMAKATDARRLCAALAPELRRRWQTSATSGPVTLPVDGDAIALDVADDLAAAPARTLPTITGADLAQLAFGYRPAAWVADRSGSSADADGVAALGALFPAVGAWIAGTDSF